MSVSAKQHLIRSFFDAFAQKINRLQELRLSSFEDEAFTLCLVYIGRLASGHFGGQPSQNRKNFCRALKQLSGNPLFGMIHPGQLRDLTQRHCLSAIPFIESVLNKQPGALLSEDELAGIIRKSSLRESQKRILLFHLWRASVANIAYEHIRIGEVQGPGSGGLSFDETIYKAHKGVTLDFDTFYAALREILKKVDEASMRTGRWFGNPDYMKG